MELGGLRFDLSAILYVNLLLHHADYFLSVSGTKDLSAYGRRCFLLHQFHSLSLNCIDLIYYRFTLRRTTAVIQGIQRHSKPPATGPTTIS